jgi:3'-phosphoadenosine 5'-phosphosulfate sulfotransferase (PAPS reductase)/FAD synthetase
MAALSKDELNSYDRILVTFSGGKDSMASFLHLIEAGVDRSKLELHHHDIDGREADADALKMDWPSTPSYVKAFAGEFNVPVFFSWRQGGFYREMMRSGASTAPVNFETPAGLKSAGGNSPQKTTRLQFPQMGGINSGRWCSAVLKIDVMRRLVANDPRFNGKRILIISGERAQESEARASYAEFEIHPTLSNQKRTVHCYRPVHKWTESQVWDIIKRHGVNPHPAYKMGWGRLSCALCIFGGKNQWASVKAVLPQAFARAAQLEAQFGKTIDRAGVKLADKAAAGTAYAGISPELAAEATSATWSGQIRVSDWQLPAGAFSGEVCGPS